MRGGSKNDTLAAGGNDTISAGGDDMSYNDTVVGGANDIVTNDATAEQIKQLYRDILGREADEGGLKYFDETGEGIDEISKALRSSKEYGDTRDASADQIKQLYKDVLGREADEAGLKYWDETGLGLDKLREEFGKYKTDDASADQIKQLYKDLFGRDPDEAGLKYWDETGAGLNDIRRELASSAEGKKLGVQDLSTISYAKPEDKTYYESFDVNKDNYISPAERAAFMVFSIVPASTPPERR